MLEENFTIEEDMSHHLEKESQADLEQKLNERASVTVYDEYGN